MQRQALRGVGEDGEGCEEGERGERRKKVEGMGPLFGGVAALQAMGQMILGVRLCRLLSLHFPLLLRRWFYMLTCAI